MKRAEIIGARGSQPRGAGGLAVGGALGRDAAPPDAADEAAELAGPGATAWPGRTRWTPSTITFSPSLNPLITAAIIGEDWPSCTRRCCALSSPSTPST